MKFAPRQREPRSAVYSYAYRTNRRKADELDVEAAHLDDEAADRQSRQSNQGVGVSAGNHAGDVDLHAVGRGVQSYPSNAEADGLLTRRADGRLRILNRHQRCRWQPAWNQRRETRRARGLLRKSAVHARRTRRAPLYRRDDA